MVRIFHRQRAPALTGMNSLNVEEMKFVQGNQNADEKVNNRADENKGIEKLFLPLFLGSVFTEFSAVSSVPVPAVEIDVYPCFPRLNYVHATLQCWHNCYPAKDFVFCVTRLLDAADLTGHRHLPAK